MATAKHKIEHMLPGLKVSAGGDCFNPLPSYQSVLEVRTPREVIMARAKSKIEAIKPGILVPATSSDPLNPFPEVRFFVNS